MSRPSSLISGSVPDRVLAMVSGGLDSLLAVVAVERAGSEARLLHFRTGTTRQSARQAVDAFAAGRLDGRRRSLEVRDVRARYLDDVLAPALAEDVRGAPCVACRSRLLSWAGDGLSGEELLVTGDVVGQGRHQSRDALAAIDAAAGLTGRVWRPLSARQLGGPAVAGATEGEAPLALHGQARRRQSVLATSWGLEGVPASKGGCCRLADAHFRRRLRDDLQHEAVCRREPDAIELATFSRTFRLTSSARVVFARDAAEAGHLAGLAGPGETLRVEASRPVTGRLVGDVDARARGLAAGIAVALARCERAPVSFDGNEPQVRDAAADDDLQDRRI